MTRTREDAGGVVINGDKVLMVSQNGDSWSLPKGGIEPGESELDAAKREIYEESGVKKLTFLKKLGSYQRYRIGKGGIGEDKSFILKITFFLFSSDQEFLSPKDPSNPEAMWVEKERVADMLTHPKDKEFFLDLLRKKII